MRKPELTKPHELFHKAKYISLLGWGERESLFITGKHLASSTILIDHKKNNHFILLRVPLQLYYVSFLQQI